MKILCMLLSLVVAILSGVLVFSIQSGHLPMMDSVAGEVGVEDALRDVSSTNLLMGSQVGLIDELVEALQLAQEELDAAKLRLNKREKNLQELYVTYIKLKQETRVLMNDLEGRLVKVEESELKNFKKLSGVYSNMQPSSAAQSLKHMEAERVALILSQMDSRAMAAILDEAVSTSADGSEFVAQWSDAIRRLNEGKEGS